MSDALKAVPITEGRGKLGTYVEQAARHHPVAFSNLRETSMLLGVEDVDERLLHHLAFNPEVFWEEGRVSIWLPELALYGIGDDLEPAIEDLLGEIEEYAAEFFGQVELYLNSPNRRDHYPYLVKAQALSLQGKLREALVGDLGVPA